MNKRVTNFIALTIAAGVLTLSEAQAQIQTTSSSFHGEATFFQQERFFFETRVLGQQGAGPGAIVLYDETFFSSYTVLTDHEEYAEGSSLAVYDASKVTAAAQQVFPMPGNLTVIGTPGPPDVSTAIDAATLLLNTASPGATIYQSVIVDTDIMRSLERTSALSQDTDTVTVSEIDDQVFVNTHTHTELAETYLTTQDTFTYTTIRLSDVLAAVPEPSTGVMCLSGLLALALRRRRRNRRVRAGAPCRGTTKAL
jgi:hypothetical protein